MTLYIPFPLFARSLVRMVLSQLQENSMIEDYDNAVIEYHFRP